MNASEPAPLRRAWLVVNPDSHSTSEEMVARVRDAVADAGLTLDRELHFPAEDMPHSDDLRAADVDTLILFGGDGTITCGATRMEDWDGRIVVLPGGTMNLIAKHLHGGADAEEITTRALTEPDAEALPYVQAEEHFSFARVIAGPAAGFVHVRERVRHRGFGAFWRALVFAWRLLWSRSIAIDGQPGRYRAIFIHADMDRQLHVDAIRAGNLFIVLRLAFAWISGNLAGSSALAQLELDELIIRSSRPVHVLFDGEEQILNAPVRFAPGITPPHFLRTKAPE